MYVEYKSALPDGFILATKAFAWRRRGPKSVKANEQRDAKPQDCQAERQRKEPLLEHEPVQGLQRTVARKGGVPEVG